MGVVGTLKEGRKEAVGGSKGEEAAGSVVTLGGGEVEEGVG